MDSKLNDFFNTTFVRGGRDLATGVDCQGLMLKLLSHFGYSAKDTDTALYATEVVAGLIKDAEQSGKWERLEKPEPGCVVVLGLDPLQPDVAQHLGVYVGGGDFIHILKKQGVVRTSIKHRYFSNKILGYWRWKNC